jgi:hypothetical protein
VVNETCVDIVRKLNTTENTSAVNTMISWMNKEEGMRTMPNQAIIRVRLTKDEHPLKRNYGTLMKII